MDDQREAFVLAHTALVRPPLVPEVELHLATELTPLWTQTQDWLEARGVEPPYWAFAWAGGQALARFIFDHPETVRGMRVVDFATGSGLVAIAAAMCGARSVLGLDIDPLACAAAQLNARHNGVTIETETRDRTGDELEETDVVLAGDVFYEAVPAERFTRWFRRLASSKKLVFVGDPGRAYVPKDLAIVARYDVPTALDLEGSVSRPAVIGRVDPDPADQAPESRVR